MADAGLSKVVVELRPFNLSDGEDWYPVIAAAWGTQGQPVYPVQRERLAGDVWRLATSQHPGLDGPVQMVSTHGGTRPVERLVCETCQGWGGEWEEGPCPDCVGGGFTYRPKDAAVTR